MDPLGHMKWTPTWLTSLTLRHCVTLIYMTTKTYTSDRWYQQGGFLAYLGCHLFLFFIAQKFGNDQSWKWSRFSKYPVLESQAYLNSIKWLENRCDIMKQFMSEIYMLCYLSLSYFNNTMEIVRNHFYNKKLWISYLQKHIIFTKTTPKNVSYHIYKKR